MTGLYFLIMCSLGILKPIKNAFALVGLGEVQFYRVYFVSAAVMLFVPAYSRLADRIPPRRLIPAIALFFGLNLLLFRALYLDGSVIFGLVFYGWYDLYAAVLVTQFFIATQLVFDARVAKRAYPVVIAGGALGATLGGAITGFSAQLLETPNLLLVAAGFLLIFTLALPGEWKRAPEPAATGKVRRKEKLTAAEFRTVLRDPHVRLIAATVLVGVLVKQLVDYQFNTITGEVFQTRDAISAFQGKFHAATQWLPLVALVALRPILQRWGVGAVLFMLPVTLLLANVGLVLWWSLAAAAVAKGADIGLRHTAERTGREILYVPVPENIKLKAKVYIDVAVEEGIGKMLSGVLILVLIAAIGYTRVGYAAAVLTLVWLVAVVAIREEYVRTLARSIQGRFASFKGVFASAADASTLPVVRQALESGDTLQLAFVLDLLDEADPQMIEPLGGELHQLLEHPSPEIRERTLTTLMRIPERIDVRRVREKVSDIDERVREAAVQTLCLARPAERERIVCELLEADEPPVRMAALACLAQGILPPEVAHSLGRSHLERRLGAAEREGANRRAELALTAATLGADSRVPTILAPLLEDSDPQVAAAALRSAGALGHEEFYARIVSALRSSRTREAARAALIRQGSRVVQPLVNDLVNGGVDPGVRRHIPAVLGGIPAQETVDGLLHSIEAPETDDLLDYRTLKVLNKLRVRHPDLTFDAPPLPAVLERELEAASHYQAARAGLATLGVELPTAKLLQSALREAWTDRRERVFRCLGLMYPPDEMYRCYLAVSSGDPIPRANALEWLEQTVGYATFQRLLPVLQDGATAGAGGVELRRVLGDLTREGDAWLAECAAQTLIELGLDGGSEERDGKMNLIEKVFLLQQIDLLHDARSSHLALLASIAEEVEVEPGTLLLQQGEPTDALYVVIRGSVELRGMGEQVLLAQNGTAFGTWALIDEAPSLVSARAIEPTQLLRITRRDFYDLLADHHELALGLLQGLARRVRTLVS